MTRNEIGESDLYPYAIHFKDPFRYRFAIICVKDTQKFYFQVKLQLINIWRTTDKSKRTAKTMCTENTEWTDTRGCKL